MKIIVEINDIEIEYTIENVNKAKHSCFIFEWGGT